VLAGAWQAEAGRWGKDYVPNVPVVSQDGRTLNFYDDLIKGKIVVLSFIYTSCKDICPLATARLGEAQDRLGDRLGRDIFFYSISIEPERDTPQRLKEYADAFHAGPGWMFLTGLPEDIKLIRDKFGDRRPDLIDHRNDVVLGNGATEEWQRENALGDIEHFVGAIRAMDPKWRGEVHEPAAESAAHAETPRSDKAVPFDTGYIMEGRQAGSAMFTKLCAGCHSIGKGDRVGPDLDGLTLRRSRAWISEFLMDPIKMRARQDPIVLALAAKYPGVRMPYLKVQESDAADLISYIDARSKTAQPKIALESLYALTTQDGTHLAPADLKGRPFAVVFGYTHCPDVCPTTLLDLSNMLESLGTDAPRLKIFFVSVDSERDTPAALKAYMQSFNPGITALTGSPEEIAKAAALFAVDYAKSPVENGSFSYDHSTKTYFVTADRNLFGTLDLESEPRQRQAMLTHLLGDLERIPSVRQTPGKDRIPVVESRIVK
jgi:cytochrome oxidase Cu insertion factor (SCO1/SenC/PrrC family)